MANKKPDDSQSDPLFTNKLAGAALFALLLIFGLPQLAAALLGGGHHGGGDHDELHLAYCCVELETASNAGAEEEAYDLGKLLAEASVTAGERGAALCISCHTLVRGGADGTGPNLWNIVNRPVASADGFKYSGALSDLGGDWTYERLDKYIENSQGYVPGTSMAQRIGRDTKRAELLAFLGSLSDDPAPFPAPLPTAVEEVAVEDAIAEEVTETVEDHSDADHSEDTTAQ